MKKVIILLVIIASIVSGCGIIEIETSKEENGKKSDEVFNQGNLEKLISDPTEYVGASIEFTGQITSVPEKDEDGTYIQVHADPINYEKILVVGISDTAIALNEDDYVRVKGKVDDEVNGENAFGGSVSAPWIIAESIEVIDYITAVSPTLKTIEINKSVDQHGFVVTLQKVELSVDETRVYLKAVNNSKETANIYTHTAKIIQGKKQYDEEYNSYAEYPELQSELLPGIETEAIISYKAIDLNIKELNFVIEGYNDDYELDFVPYSFDVSW